MFRLGEGARRHAFRGHTKDIQGLYALSPGAVVNLAVARGTRVSAATIWNGCFSLEMLPQQFSQPVSRISQTPYLKILLLTNYLQQRRFLAAVAVICSSEASLAAVGSQQLLESYACEQAVG